MRVWGEYIQERALGPFIPWFFSQAGQQFVEATGCVSLRSRQIESHRTHRVDEENHELWEQFISHDESESLTREF